MLKFLPIVLAVAYGLVVWRLSLWRTRAELDARSAELVDPGLAPMLHRLARALDLPRVKVMLYDIPAVNGLAAPDGRIFITRGLLDRYRSGALTDGELASVIAHELGHVALGHLRRRMVDFAGQNAVRAALVALLSRVIPGVGAILANVATGLVMARLSRRDEYEADAYASALLVKAGIGTGPQKSLFQKLPALTQTTGGQMPAWFLSHPPPAERIAAIERNEARWGLTAPSTTP